MSTTRYRRQDTADAARLPRMNTKELRESFLVESLFQSGVIELVGTNLDRAIIGGAVPTVAPLTLEVPEALRAAAFTERRELGILNLGNAGSVSVDGTTYPLARFDALYIGRGRHEIAFASVRPEAPARLFLSSYPAHAVYPTQHARHADAEPVRLGNASDANRRTIFKYIHEGGIRSCQLVMGFTRLEEGSVWNSMPPHHHHRRSEIYLYFDVAPAGCVMHFMGPPEGTRHLVTQNEQAVLSPPWSIHCGCGTQNYGFAWTMGGENQEFTDMDPVPVESLR